MSAASLPSPDASDADVLLDRVWGAEAILDALFEQAEVGMTVVDRALVYRRVNEAFAEFGNTTPDAMVGRTLAQALPPEVAPDAESATRQVLELGEPIVGRELVARPGGDSGHTRWVRSHRYPIRSEDGEVVGVVSIVTNVTDLKNTHARLDEAVARERLNHALLDALFDSAPLGIAVIDRDLRFTRVNAVRAAETGMPSEEMIGRMPSEIYPSEQAARIERSLAQVFETGQPIVGEPEEEEEGAPLGTGRRRHWLVSRYPLRGPDGEIVAVATIRSEVTDLRQAEAELKEMLAREQSAKKELEEARRELAAMNEQLGQLAATDSLTGLWNRSSLRERISLAVERARRGGRAVALVYVDLNGFKCVNDTFGHAAGDELLRTLGDRLRSAARQTDVTGRLGGDEFVVLLADLDPDSAADTAQAVADRVRLALTEPFSVQGTEARISASIGFSVYPRDAADEDQLLANADAAMYTGKHLLGPR